MSEGLSRAEPWFEGVGILMYTGQLPDISSQQILAGTIVVGRLCVRWRFVAASMASAKIIKCPTRVYTPGGRIMIHRSPPCSHHVVRAWGNLGTRGLEGVRILGPTPRLSRKCSCCLRSLLTACRRETVGFLPLAARKQHLVFLVAFRPLALRGHNFRQSSRHLWRLQREPRPKAEPVLPWAVASRPERASVPALIPWGIEDTDSMQTTWPQSLSTTQTVMFEACPLFK